MKPERWKKIDDLVQAALEQSGAERAAFIDEACAGDDLLRREVESVLAYQQDASGFLESPAIEQAAELIADSQTPSLEGRTISHYKLTRRIAHGGMGEVYLAHDTSLDRRVAIKFLSDELTTDELARKRLVREARAAARLDHPNICSVYEVAEHDGLTFIVMQHIEGETLAERIRRKLLEIKEVLDLAVQVADGLSEAHSHGIIHRDIKPHNIMLTARGQVKVLDFGLAKTVLEKHEAGEEASTLSMLTAPETTVGTVPYMSPEQVRGETLDARTDIFSFGVVIYEMISGRNPFQAESAGATMSSILTKDPAPLARYALELPDELQRIVRKAISKDKQGRYQGIKDLLIDLRELKQELEFEAKFERSTGQEFRDVATTKEGDSSGGRAEAETAPQQTVLTGEAFTTRTSSSTRIVIGEIKRHKLGVSLALAALVIAAVASYFYFNREPVLTDHDTILLADFDNKTGEEIFDGTLKQGLAVQLEQSPFLNLFPDTRVRETLKLMNRSPNERVTTEIGREICQRQGLKALIAGSIAPLGSHYVVTLAAVNSKSGAVVAREQTEAESREQVLKALSQAASRLREKLGESINSIQKFDAPLEVTTSSLEALKAYSLGQASYDSGKMYEAIRYYKHAVEIDPNFAHAYRVLAYSYANTSQSGLAAQYAEKAYALRDRVSELEKLSILNSYYLFVTGEEEKRIDEAELRKRLYPHKPDAFTNLSHAYSHIGQFEKAVPESREALRLNPNSSVPYVQLGGLFIRLNRFEEAREIYQRAFQQSLDLTIFHGDLFQIAFVSGETVTMQQQLDWAKGKPDEYVALDWQTGAAAFAGQWRQAQDLSRRSIELTMRSDAKQVASEYAAEAALRGAVFDQCGQTKAAATQALALDHSQLRTTRAVLALALCGETLQAQRLLDELVKRYPKNTLINGLWAPSTRAAMELRRGNAAQAIVQLQPASRYEAAAEFWPQYLRGMAFLTLKRGREAAAEFQKILDHRGEALLSPLYPLAHLGIARAATLTGDVEGSRKAYQDFFALWKDADPDLPILQQAREEYEKLK